MADICEDCSESPIYARQRCRRCYQRWYMRERRRAANPYLAVWASAKPGHKICRHCQHELPSDVFAPRAAGKDGLASWCRPCVAMRKRQRRAADPDARQREQLYERRPEVQMRIRARNAAREYEITLEQYSEMVEQQAGRCAVCSRKRKLAVDHCHKTGKVRALLCYPCNIALGQVNDNVKLLMDLAGYVSRHAENEPQPSSLPNAPQQRTPLHATPH